MSNVIKQSWSRDNFLISTDQDMLDNDFIHDYLCNQSYWAKGIPKNVVDTAMDNSLCFGLFEGNLQMGFARVITDYATFAYMADVFIEEEYRGQGLGKWLIQCILEHQALQGLRKWMLATSDMQSLYKKFGFTQLEEPHKVMGKTQQDIYTS